MTRYVVRIWNGEDYEDSEDTFLIINASSELKAKEKADFILNTENKLYEIDARNEKTGQGVWQIIPEGYYYRGEVTHTKPLKEVIADHKDLFTKAKALRKKYLGAKKHE